MDDLIDSLTTYVERSTSTLGDEEYLEVLEGVIDNLQLSVNAKREDQERASADGGEG